MRDLNHDFKLLCQRNRDGSMATQHDREEILSLVADQLHDGGFHRPLQSGNGPTQQAIPSCGNLKLGRQFPSVCPQGLAVGGATGRRCTANPLGRLR